MLLLQKQRYIYFNSKNPEMGKEPIGPWSTYISLDKSTLQYRLCDCHIAFPHCTSCTVGHRTQKRLTTFCKSTHPITITITIGCVLLQNVVIPKHTAFLFFFPIIIFVEIKIALNNDYCTLKTHRCNILCTILDC